jgi:hypothetical protein
MKNDSEESLLWAAKAGMQAGKQEPRQKHIQEEQQP